MLKKRKSQVEENRKDIEYCLRKIKKLYEMIGDITSVIADNKEIFINRR